MDPLLAYANLGTADPVRTTRNRRTVWTNTIPKLPAGGPVPGILGGRNSKPECQAETLKPVIDAVSGTPAEQWIPCRGHSSTNDVVCPAHRRQVNLAAATGGIRISGNSFIRVPAKAFKHPTCRFPPTYIRFARTELENKAAGKTASETIDDSKKYEIWDPNAYDGIVLAAVWKD